MSEDGTSDLEGLPEVGVVKLVGEVGESPEGKESGLTRRWEDE